MVVAGAADPVDVGRGVFRETRIGRTDFACRARGSDTMR